MFICSLPITRKEFIVARYIQVIIFNTIFSIVALLIGVALHLTGFMQTGNNSINFIITSYVIVLGFAGIILPFYTLIKNTRAIVLISLIIYFLIFLGRSILEALLEILRRNVQIKNIIQGVWASEYLVAWIFAFSLVFCIASLFLSIRLYDSRDLI
ncbi:MAG: ABC-2 transporter permease [Clostridiales bacterium]|nr:ABC-2 transporter permease [Clostridiales bacterium]